MPDIKAHLRFLLIGFRGHWWVFDKRNMVEAVQKAGFGEIRSVPGGSMGIPDPGDLNLFERAEESLYCEGVKPLG